MKQSDDPNQPSSTLGAGYEPQLRTPLKTTPVSTVSFGTSPDDSDPPAEEEILAKYDWYIILVAWQIVNGNARIVRPEVLDLMVDDLIQNSRIKLWQALRNGVTIHSMKGLIRQLVHNEFINLVRQLKPVLPLLIDEFGELCLGKPIIGQGENMDTPENIVGREMVVAELLEEAANGVVTMSPCQMEAMICCLKETVEDVSQLVMIFRKHGIEIEEMAWPEEKSEKVRLKASLSPARKKMRLIKYESFCA